MARMLTRVLLLLMFICIGISSCGGGDEKGRPANADEQLIIQMIENWMSFLEAGDEGSLEAMFDPSYWAQSPTRTESSDFTGNSLSASSVLVAVEGEDATASFTLTVAGEGSLSVTWILLKTAGKWRITYEEWTS